MSSPMPINPVTSSHVRLLSRQARQARTLPSAPRVSKPARAWSQAAMPRRKAANQIFLRKKAASAGRISAQATPSGVRSEYTMALPPNVHVGTTATAIRAPRTLARRPARSARATEKSAAPTKRSTAMWRTPTTVGSGTNRPNTTRRDWNAVRTVTPSSWLWTYASSVNSALSTTARTGGRRSSWSPVPYA